MSEPTWRVGRSQPINIYYGGEFVAVAFGSPAIAAAIVERMNEGLPDRPGTGVDHQAVTEAINATKVPEAMVLRGAFDRLDRKLAEALAELEGFMQSEHREKCGGNSNLDDYGFGRCKDRVCTGYRERLTELRAAGE